VEIPFGKKGQKTSGGRVDPSAAEWRRRRQPESSGAAAAEKQTAENIGRRRRHNFHGAP